MARRAPRGRRMRVRGTAPRMGPPSTCQRGLVRRARLERAMRAPATVGGGDVTGRDPRPNDHRPFQDRVNTMEMAVVILSVVAGVVALVFHVP